MSTLESPNDDGDGVQPVERAEGPNAQDVVQPFTWTRGVEVPPFHAANAPAVRLLVGILDGSMAPPKITVSKRP